MTHELPGLPAQSGWALEMHGTCVSFVNNAEKAGGMSPGCEAPIYTADQMRAYAAAHAASLEAEVARLLKALDGAYALSIGWAAHYQHNHSLQAIHPMHQEILDECKALLAKRWAALGSEGS